MSFSGKVVIVTGASSGIGRAAAVGFAKEGAEVLLVGRRERALRELSAEIAMAGGHASALKEYLAAKVN